MTTMKARNTMKIINYLSSSVVALYQVRRPPTIHSTVIPIIVNTVNGSLFYPVNLGMSEIFKIHIVPEFFKRLPKKFNSSSAIITVISIFGRIAPAFSAKVDVVKSLLWSLSYRKTMFKRIFTNKVFRTETPTRFAVSTPQITTRNNGGFTALTLAKKQVSPSFLKSCKFYYKKLSKLFINQIDSSHFLLPLTPTRFASRWALGAAKLLIAI